jgi:hypothetical protein
MKSAADTPQVLKALLQQGVSVPIKSKGHCGVALFIPYQGWWFVGSLYHIVYHSVYRMAKWGSSINITASKYSFITMFQEGQSHYMLPNYKGFRLLKELKRKGIRIF